MYLEGSDDPDTSGKMTEFMGPGQVDRTIRQAIQFCWMSLPKAQRTPDEVERQVRRIVERAIKDFRDDSQAFGLDALPDS
jgi:hypothetical protein